MQQHKGKSVNTHLGENYLPITVITSSDQTKTCTACNETKNKKEFHRVLTLAQSKAILRRPNLTKRHTLYSTLCQSCRQQRKSRAPLTTKQIRNKITSGDMNPTIGEALIKQKREALPKKRAKVMKEYWENKRLSWQSELKSNLQAQVTTYANRYYSYQNQMPEHPTDRQHAMLEQHSYNYKEAQRIRKELMKQAKDGREISPDTKINDLIKRRKVG